jgi:DNA-binding transcriptional MerR regulator
MLDPVDDFPALVPARDVAAAYNVTLRTLSNWEKQGILEPVRLAGRRYYRSADLLKLQEKRLWAHFPNDLDETSETGRH